MRPSAGCLEASRAAGLADDPAGAPINVSRRIRAVNYAGYEPLSVRSS